MKKLAGLFVILLLVLAAVLAIRAQTEFSDHQLPPAVNLAPAELNAGRAVQNLSRAITYPTVSYDDRSRFDAEAFTGFRKFLENAYPRIHESAERTVVNGYSLVYRFAGSRPALEPVLFMGHFDVVPIEDITLDDWSHPPFSGAVEDGIIWGRGAVDDKLTVIALMEAMESMLEQGVAPERDIYFAFGHDEEVGGKDGAAKVAEYFADQGVAFDFVMDEGGAITEGMMSGIDNPVAVVGVAEKGYVNLVLTVNAPGGHSSQPPEQTALGILARAIVRVEDHPFPARLDNIAPTFEALGDRMPFLTRLAMANLWLFSPLVERRMLRDKDDAAGIRTTTAATMASGSPKSNILPTRATAVINFRILPGDTVTKVRQHVTELIDDERVSVTSEYDINPSPASPSDSRGYELIARTIRAMDPEILVAPYMVRGGTDAKYFYKLSPNVYRFMMLRIDPETIRYIHGIDEHVAEEDFIEAVRFNHYLLQQAMADS
jgi:carboxypeptidase PM20D1